MLFHYFQAKHPLFSSQNQNKCTKYPSLLNVSFFLIVFDSWFPGFIVQELESSLAKKESYIKELESNLHEQKEVNDRQHNEIKLLHDRLNNEARRIKSLERESDRLRSEISLLESKVWYVKISKQFQEPCQLCLWFFFLLLLLLLSLYVQSFEELDAL